MTNALLIIFLCITVVYSAIILVFTSGWYRIKEFSNSGKIKEVKVSVVVALKNEEQNITSLFENLISQDYKSDLYELIFVDDGSDDVTFEMLNSLKLNHASRNIKIFQTDASSRGKKNAIEKAVKESCGEIILCTDGDCRINPSWIRTIADYFAHTKVKMLSGPVMFYPVISFFGMFQSIEFSSLVASGAGSIKMGIPVMCNGANLAFKKKVFEEVNGYKGNKKYASGDDIFLMQKIITKFGRNAVKFLKSQEAVIKTTPAYSLGEFINQRKRWVSKSSGYTDFWLISTSLIVYLFSFTIIASFILSAFYSGWIYIALIFFGIKLIVDFPILLGISIFNKQAKYLWFYPVFQLLYIPYVVFIGLLGNFGKYKWK